MSEIRPLYDFQRDVYYYTGQVQHPALFLQMRLGKTIITCRRLLHDFPNTSGILIAAPLCTLYGWEQELLKEGVPAKDICYLTGTRQERFDRLCNRSAFSLINKEGFLALPEIERHNWDAVVCDESTFLKNPKAKVTKFFCQHFRSVKRRFILTGTPAPESDTDLFQQLYFLDPRILGFKNFWEFRFQFFEQLRPYEWTITPEGKVWLGERLKKYCYTLSRKDVKLDVRKIYERRMVELPPVARKAYDTAESAFLLEIEGKVVGKTIYAMEKFIWLRRLCGGFVLGEHLHGAKADVLMELLLGELRHDQVVVWCQFLDEISILSGYLDKEKVHHTIIEGAVPGWRRVERMKDFQAGRARVLLAQPECFKYGVDLSCSDTVIYFSSPLGLETRLQSEDRLVNINKPSPILVIDLIARNTIEEDLYQASQNKDIRQDMLKQLIQRRKR